MTEPRWLSAAVIRAIHSDQVRAHGGSLGLRDAGLLESALARPVNLVQYQPDSDLYAVAAAYGFGIARNHPFIDGNKRVAFQAMYVFLGLNGFRIDAAEEEVVEVMLSLARGDFEEEGLAARLRQRVSTRS